MVDEAAGVAPPEDYPARAWVEDPADLYYVPVELRADYAAHRGLTDRDGTAYWYGGAVRVTALSPDESMARALAAGRTIADLEAYPQRLIVKAGDTLRTGGTAGHETHWVETREQVDGPDGYAELTHRERLTRARQQVANRERAEADRLRLVAAATCPACGRVDHADRPVPVPVDHPLARRTRLCTPCRGIAERVLADSERLESGRLRAEVVRDYLADLEGGES